MKISGWIVALVGLSLGACAPGGEPGGTEEAPQLGGAEIAAALEDESIFFLDVREPSELEELGTVEGYVNIPIDELADRLDEIPRDKRILTA